MTHQGVRPKPSPIPEELAGGRSDIPMKSVQADVISVSSKSSDDASQNHLQIVADFESDGGGEYEVLAHPTDAQRIGADMIHPGFGINEDDDPYSSSGSDSSESSDKSKSSNDFRHTFFASLFAHNKSSSSSSSDLDSESSMDYEDELDDFGYPVLPTFYQSGDESGSNHGGHDMEEGKGASKDGNATVYTNQAFDPPRYENVVTKPPGEDGAEAAVARDGDRVSMRNFPPSAHHEPEKAVPSVHMKQDENSQSPQPPQSRKQRKKKQKKQRVHIQNQSQKHNDSNSSYEA